MKEKILFAVLLLLLLLVETTIISYPFIFIFSLFSMLIFKSVRMAIFVFVIGILLDTLRVVPIGMTSVLVLTFGIAVSFYARSLHAADILIFSGVIFILTLIYSILAHYPLSIFWSVVTFGSILFLLYSIFSKQGMISRRDIIH